MPIEQQDAGFSDRARERDAVAALLKSAQVILETGHADQLQRAHAMRFLS
jgi:hypothetical protein